MAKKKAAEADETKFGPECYAPEGEKPCGQPTQSLGLCTKHYFQFRRGRLGVEPGRTPNGQGKGSFVGFRADTETHAGAKDRAAGEGKSLSDWIRALVLRELKRGG